MIHRINKNIICNDSLKCSDIIVTKLESSNMQLHAQSPQARVNGSVTIYHKQNDHTIIVEYYDKDENPNSYHNTIFKKPQKIPTLSEVKSKL